MKIELEGGNTQRGQMRAVFVVVPRFNLATLITMIETMRIANYLLPEAAFSWQVVSFDGATITASNGMTVTVQDNIDSIEPADFVFVLGSWGTEKHNNRGLISWLRKRARAGERICSVELGCYILARAGLLAGRTATTHWSWLSGFQESFSDITVAEQLFTIGDRVLSCAGGLAGVDLMLHLIEESHGSALCGEIADQMMYHPIRPATAPQRRTLGQGAETAGPMVRQAISLIEDNIEDPLGVPAIAKAVGVSQRQLERQFKAQIGCTVVQFSVLMRLQHARVLLISTTLSVREIATASGFNSRSHFAHSFNKFFGRRPSEYREGWPQDEAAPSWPGTLSEFLASLRQERRSTDRTSRR